MCSYENNPNYNSYHYIFTQISESQWERIDSGMGAANIESFEVNNSGLFAGTCGNNLFFSTNNGLSWNRNALALQGRCFSSLAVNGNRTYLGIYGGPVGTEGVYLSDNNGINWYLTSLNGKSINALGINGNIIFAGPIILVYINPTIMALTGFRPD